MAGSLKRKVTNLKAESGVEYVSDTVARVGNFEYIIPTTDTVIAAITLASGALNTTSNTLVGATLPAGIPIPLRFTGITLTSGTCVLVNKVAE